MRPVRASGIARALACAAALALAPAGCEGCKDKPAAAPTDKRVGPNRPAAVPGQPRLPGAPRVGGGSGSATPTRPLGRVLAPVSVEEVTAALPTFTGATVMGEVEPMLSGRQARVAWCIAAPDAATALQVVQAGLTGGGWIHPVVRGQAPRLGVAAQKNELRLSITIAPVPRPGCSPADGKFYAAGNVHKSGAAGTATGAAPAAPEAPTP